METSTTPTQESSQSAPLLTELPEVLFWVGLVRKLQQQLKEYREQLAAQQQQIDQLSEERKLAENPHLAEQFHPAESRPAKKAKPQTFRPQAQETGSQV